MCFLLGKSFKLNLKLSLKKIILIQGTIYFCKCLHLYFLYLYLLHFLINRIEIHKSIANSSFCFNKFGSLRIGFNFIA